MNKPGDHQTPIVANDANFSNIIHTKTVQHIKALIPTPVKQFKQSILKVPSYFDISTFYNMKYQNSPFLILDAVRDHPLLYIPLFPSNPPYPPVAPIIPPQEIY